MHVQHHVLVPGDGTADAPHDLSIRIARACCADMPVWRGVSCMSMMLPITVKQHTHLLKGKAATRTAWQQRLRQAKLAVWQVVFMVTAT